HLHPGSASSCPSGNERAQGMPDAGRTRKQTGQPEQPALPARVVLTAASRSPWSAGLVSLHPPGLMTRGLIPASGDRDHTTWPSAPAPPVLRHSRVHRSPPHVRDDAYAPCVGTGCGEMIMDFWKMKEEYFS